MNAVQTFQNYLALTKPGIILMVIVTGLPALMMGQEVWPAPMFFILTLTGIALAASSANIFNCYIERDRDSLMERTRTRPLPAAKLNPQHALIFGLLLAAISTALLYKVGGLLTASLGIASTLFYVFIYTVWLKPTSAWNAVIGGAAGAAAPLIADAAVNGAVGITGWILFGIVFFWQPPHVWAIALYRKEDYEKAGIPMLPSVLGDQPTRWWMLWWTLALIPVTLIPVLLKLLGPVYGVSALFLNAWFVWHAVRVLNIKTDAAARKMFFVSLIYLFALFSMMLVDLTVF